MKTFRENRTFPHVLRDSQGKLPAFLPLQGVTAGGFTASSPKGLIVPEKKGLTVTEVYLSSTESPNHWRYVVKSDEPYSEIEGAAHFFFAPK